MKDIKNKKTNNQTNQTNNTNITTDPKDNKTTEQNTNAIDTKTLIKDLAIDWDTIECQG